MAHRQDGGGDFGRIELVAEPGRARAWTLLVNGTPQSHVDLDDPGHLLFEYMRRLGHVVDLAAPAGEPLRVLHLGGGGLTLARYVAATRPGSRQLAVDSDAALVDLVRQRLPFSKRDRGRTVTGQVRVRVADARDAVRQVPAGAFDLVVADLFAGSRTAAHLTSAEFDAAAARALAASGLYAVNIADGPPLAHARARVAAARSVFAQACLMADAAVLRGRRFGNLVLVTAVRELPLASLGRQVASDPFPARLVHGSELDRFTAGARPLTDARPQSSPAPPPGLFSARTRPAAR
ncbi:MAG TPA: fused MFS/spermidine synthase [Streptosporangiaceae bacterium]|nr:fused MFS/spermidine synthase [Streptosporangiaceae bacterium]